MASLDVVLDVTKTNGPAATMHGTSTNLHGRCHRRAFVNDKLTTLLETRDG
jgi:hypothetical protein